MGGGFETRLPRPDQRLDICPQIEKVHTARRCAGLLLIGRSARGSGHVHRLMQAGDREFAIGN